MWPVRTPHASYYAVCICCQSENRHATQASDCLNEALSTGACVFLEKQRAHNATVFSASVTGGGSILAIPLTHQYIECQEKCKVCSTRKPNASSKFRRQPNRAAVPCVSFAAHAVAGQAEYNA